MHIHVLPPEVASQIAAGEVIERPASVIKELLENSLDSASSRITIISSGAGKSMIEVADNGTGISAEEISLAVERHATSKLNNPEDLRKITTLGFRGEALASIASIARLTIISRTPASELASKIIVEGGHVKGLHSLGAPIGTTVRVEDLFYNVPARLKFLKHDRTERGVIDNLVMRYAVAYPSIQFSLTQENRNILTTSGNGDRREVLAALYNPQIARQLIEINFEDTSLIVDGFTSPVSLTRSNRREIYLFINGRPVQDKSLSAAVIKAYHTLLMVNRYPIIFLFLTLPPEKVDVNVHPTKAEVRFQNPDLIFSNVQSAVRRALLAHKTVPGVLGEQQWMPDSSQYRETTRLDTDWRPVDSHRFPQTGQENIIKPSISPPLVDFQSRTTLLLRSIGQIISAYLVAEGPDGLYLIDQHAAHERILFEKLTSDRNQSFPSQILLEPAVVDFPPDQARIIFEQLDILTRLGFQVEPFGKNSFLVRSVPAILENFDPEDALRVVVEDFEEDESPLASQIDKRIIARICKKAAIKAGQNLSPEEQRSLLLALESCQSPRTCPHGRPTMIHLSVDLLERQFGRKGSR